MFVVMIGMGCVPAPIVDVVDVVTMRDGHMSATIAVNMVVAFVHGVPIGRLAFVVVVFVQPVQMAVMHVVDVITMRDRYVSTPFAMDMVMVDMLLVCSSHRFPRRSAGQPTSY